MEEKIYVDALKVHVAKDSRTRFVGSRTGHRWCHMWSDSVDALHGAAFAIGLKPEWFQDRPGFPHYDLTPSRRQKALEFGAVEMDLKDYLRLNGRRCCAQALQDKT